MFVPLAFLAGAAFQFDWSEDWAVIADERTKLAHGAEHTGGRTRLRILRNEMIDATRAQRPEPQPWLSAIQGKCRCQAAALSGVGVE